MSSRLERLKENKNRAVARWERLRNGLFLGLVIVMATYVFLRSPAGMPLWARISGQQAPLIYAPKMPLD